MGNLGFMGLQLAELSGANAAAVNGLSLKPGQEQFIAPPSYSLAEGLTSPDNFWSRVIMQEGQVVGYVRAHFDGKENLPEFHSCLWRINVGAQHQGQGVGEFAVRAAADEARTRGMMTLTALWEPGEDGPGGFFERAGFIPSGLTQYGEVIGTLALERRARASEL
jgi:diamine N-acetyltransferase